ncbi:glycosyltransferase [Saccharomonospora glauca]|uniref:Glycosyltransferase n=1 Tax=Saccharomonospora glauca K62 TaxID=928724 RepID=I1CWM2_9PSEU|nr:glycosyltransferase [Saccharomonospora glauca]EIE97096.1 glycosyltransferase [Saccharomonospora glauca K62]
MTDARTRLPQAAACTVVTQRHLPTARVLARSYVEHHPGRDFVVLVADRAEVTEALDGYRLVGYRELDVDEDEYLRLATCFPESELVDVVVPLLLRRLLADVEVAVYLASEAEVLAPLTDVVRLGAEHGVVLVPRLLEPLPRDGREPDTLASTFDSGCLAVGRSGRSFLDFWFDRAVRDASDERTPVPDLVPALFPHTVLRDPGLGVGYWNLHERPLSRRDDGTLTAADTPLRLVHFTGYRPEQPWLFTTHCRRPRVRLSRESTLRELCEAHRGKLLEAGYRETPEDAVADTEYGFAELPDGSPLTEPMRRLFHTSWLDATAPELADDPLGRPPKEIPPHPFGDDHGAEFRRWLASPDSPLERAAGLNRLAMRVWADRVDLQAVFPRPYHTHGAAFRQWCRTHGLDEGLLPEWALPREPAAPSPPVDEFGVNVAGYLTAELGLGEMGRVIHRAVQESGVPVVSVVEEHSLSRTVRTALDEPDTVGTPRFPVSILAVNADYTELLLDTHPEVGHERYRIGLWAWELEDFPDHLHEGFALVDEVWTVSEFCARAIAPHSPVPVKVIPVPVLDPGEKPRPDRRPGEAVRFLFAFDFNSTGQRKNPWGVVEAFRRAFGDRDDVRLTIKATNGHLHTSAEERLRHVIGDDPRIELLDRYLSVAELDALYANSDAYVSLHRSEGFGLTVAEAMVRGMPVIATDYGGTTEFFDATVGWPIPYGRTEVGPGWEPYQKDGVWADPDLDAAAAAMRAVADDPAEARRRGKAAREHILRTRSMAAATEWMRTELRAAYDTWRARRRHGTDAEGTPTALAPLDEAREALHWKPDPAAPHRLPFAPALRKLVNRALDHHDEHQRKILGRITDGTRETLAALARRIDRDSEAHEHRLDAVEAKWNRRVARLEARIDALERKRRTDPDEWAR